MSMLADWLADGLDRLIPRTRFARRLEHFMSLTSDALSELDAATTAVADRIDRLVGQVDGLDANTASQIAAETARLRGLAADPENPVPADPTADI